MNKPRVVEVTDITVSFRSVTLPDVCPKCSHTTSKRLRETTLRYEENVVDADFDAVDSNDGDLFGSTAYSCIKCNHPFT